MLNAPPPGYNAPAMNRQAVGQFNMPGPQGLAPQGYFPGSSSFAPPSSMPAPNQPGLPGIQGHPLARAGQAAPPVSGLAAMVQALRGRR